MVAAGLSSGANVGRKMADLSEEPYVEVHVEIPRGSRNKYEYDHQKRAIRLDRVLYSSVHYPTDYGYIPNTVAADGDPLDILVVVEEPTFPGCFLQARPIGVLKMVDEQGEDDKILAVPMSDPRFDEVDDISKLPSHWLKEIENFFNTYKTLEGIETRVFDWQGAAEAWGIIQTSRERVTSP